jgi:cytochrome c oxidase cbb3-type subunit 3/ubiquinol-cytochrome c reductase cytochrome c subunit
LADNANALSNQEFLRSVTDPFLADAIVHGRPGTAMSAWGMSRNGPLTLVQVDTLVDYLRGWQTVPDADVHEDVVEGDVERGATAYAEHCASCHAEDGGGMTALSLNNPWFLATASDGQIRYAIQNGRPDTVMQAYSEVLSQEEVDDITALIRSWATEVDVTPMDPFVPDWENLVVNEGGATPEFMLREGRYVPIDQVKAALDAGQEIIFADARASSDYGRRNISGAISLPFYDVARYADRLPRDTWIVAYCGCPHAASGRTMDALVALGFPMVAVLDEGYYEWLDRGYPVTPPLPEEPAE